jgi:hypothetical protein
MSDKRNEVTMTAKEVAAFFAALAPNLNVRVLDQGYEDGDLDQWYGYLITFRVIEADWQIDEWEEGRKKVETIRQFHRATMPWLHKGEE